MGHLSVCVMGVGGVGGYFGGKLAHTFSSEGNPSVDIFFVARGKHLKAIEQNGLVLKSPEFGSIRCKPNLVTGRISDLPAVDVFMICVKGYDLMGAAASMRDHIRENSIILPLLNGADIRERLRSQIKTGIIFPACTYLSAYMEAPGVVAHIGIPGKIIFGIDPDHPNDIPHDLFGVFEKASIDFEWRDDAQPAIWEKYLFIASFGLISARYQRTLGEILEDPSLKEEVVGIMNEVNAIALKKGIRLPDGVVNLSLKKAALFPRDTQTSLQRDIQQKKGKSELELFGGTIVNLGEKLGTPTPTTQKIYRELEGV